MSYFGVIGLGSMGKRRVRDLLLQGHKVVGYDIREDRMEQARNLFGIPTLTSFENIVKDGVSGIVISTPPDQHGIYYKKSFEAGLPFFSEASILTPKGEWFSGLEAQKKIATCPSATMRFHPLLQSLREKIHTLGRAEINSVHHASGAYLPFWHPWEPYEQYYAGKDKTTSAVRESITFELDWLCWTFGRIKSVGAMIGIASSWTTNIDDTYLLQFEFESGLIGSLNIELHQISAFRTIRVATRKTSLFLDVIAQELRHYDLETDSWKITKPKSLQPIGGFHYEQVYFKEIEAFAASVEGKAVFPKSWAEDRHISDVLFAAEESWKRRAWVSVAEIADSYDGFSLATFA